METNSFTLAENLVPAMPIHPGSTLGEELKARGIRQKVFAATIGMQATHLSALIHGVRNITADIAAKLELGLPEIPASLWLKLQEQYNLDVKRKQLGTSRLVSGYSAHNYPRPALAKDLASYSGWSHLTVTLPDHDIELFSQLANRFGWEINPL